MSAEPPKSDWVCPDVGGAPVTEGEAGAWMALLVGAVALRLAFAPDVLFDWDSANYAWGLVDFDVYEHQPHAPGYPVFVALLWLARRLPGSEVVPFLVVNSVLTVATLLLLASMVRRRVGPAVAWMLAATFAVCPPFWFQGAVSAAYVAECFGSVLVAATAVHLARRELPVWLAALAWALAIGIRPNGVVTLIPVALYGLWLRGANRRELLLGGLAFGVGCSLWFVPLMVGSGGLARFQEASSALVAWQVQAGSVLSGKWRFGVQNFRHLVLYFADAMNVLLLLVMVDWLVAAVRGRIGRRWLALLALWFFPGAAVYALHHLPKSGYVLTLAPIGFLVAAVVAHEAIDGLEGLRRRVLVGLHVAGVGAYLALNTVAFFSAVPWELLAFEDAELPLPRALVITGDYGRTGLAYRTWPQEHVRALVDGMDPERDLGVFVFGAHELHRIETWYHPEHWLVATSIAHQRAYARVGQPPWNDTFGDFQQVLLRSPVFDRTLEMRTFVGSDGERLLLRRAGGSLWLELVRRPERIVVFVPCPPCDVVALPGVEAGARLPVGAGYAAREMKLTAP